MPRWLLPPSSRATDMNAATRNQRPIGAKAIGLLLWLCLRSSAKEAKLLGHDYTMG
jgi:hypothetical protein